MDLGEIEREVGLFAAGIVGKRVDPALELAEEEPAGSLGPNQHDRKFKLEVGKSRLDGVGRGRIRRAGDFRAGPGTRRSMRGAAISRSASQQRSRLDQTPGSSCRASAQPVASTIILAVRASPRCASCATSILGAIT